MPTKKSTPTSVPGRSSTTGAAGPASHSKAPPARGSKTPDDGEPSSHESVDYARRPAPGETSDTVEHRRAPIDAEGQNSGRTMREELFMSAEDDDAGGLPHQREANFGSIKEGKLLPGSPDGEPKSLPDEPPTL